MASFNERKIFNLHVFIEGDGALTTFSLVFKSFKVSFFCFFFFLGLISFGLNLSAYGPHIASMMSEKRFCVRVCILKGMGL